MEKELSKESKIKTAEIEALIKVREQEPRIEKILTLISTSRYLNIRSLEQCYRSLLS